MKPPCQAPWQTGPVLPLGWGVVRAQRLSRDEVLPCLGESLQSWGCRWGLGPDPTPCRPNLHQVGLAELPGASHCDPEKELN